MGSWSCIAYEEALHLRESREVTREPRAKGDPSARGGELQSRAWSIACLGRFARRTKKKERLLVVYRERKESSPFPPPLAASRLTRALSRHLKWRACWQATWINTVQPVSLEVWFLYTVIALTTKFKAGLNLSAQLCFFTLHQLLLFPKYVKYQQVQSNNANIKTKLNAGLALRQRDDLL